MRSQRSRKWKPPWVLPVIAIATLNDLMTFSKGARWSCTERPSPPTADSEWNIQFSNLARAFIGNLRHCRSLLLPAFRRARRGPARRSRRLQSVDDQGIVHYTDEIPLEAVNEDNTELNDKGCRTRRSRPDAGATPREKTRRRPPEAPGQATRGCRTTRSRAAQYVHDRRRNRSRPLPGADDIDSDTFGAGIYDATEQAQARSSSASCAGRQAHAAGDGARARDDRHGAREAERAHDLQEEGSVDGHGTLRCRQATLAGGLACCCRSQQRGAYQQQRGARCQRGSGRRGPAYGQVAASPRVTPEAAASTSAGAALVAPPARTMRSRNAAARYWSPRPPKIDAGCAAGDWRPRPRSKTRSPVRAARRIQPASVGS